VDIFKVDFSKLPAEQQAYFKSPEFLNLSPSAKISIVRERLSSKPTADEIEAQKWAEHDSMMKIYEDRHRVEEARIEASRQHLAERKRRYLN